MTTVAITFAEVAEQVRAVLAALARRSMECIG